MKYSLETKMTFEIALDASNDLLLEDYLNQTNSSISEVARESAIEFINDIYYLSAKSRKLMAEYRKRPEDVCTHAELMRHYGLT